MYVEKIKPETVQKANPDEKLTVELGEFVTYPLARMDNGRLVREDGLVISESMRKAINLTYYRRHVQIKANQESGMTPTTIFSSIKDMGVKVKKKEYSLVDEKTVEKEMKRIEFEMDLAASNLDFEKAADLRDELITLRRRMKK
jgi:excinuclease UvrABC helicase subunit UvrB